MDPEDENGSAGQGQNLHDLQNYLSTFNKEIEPGDDVLANMDVDSGVGDVSELYSSNPDNPLQDSADGPVTSQFSSGFYSEQGILDTPLSDESTHQIQNMVGSVDTEADMAASIKEEVGSIDLENVQAHLAQLSHGMGDIHTSSIPQGLIMTSLSDSLDPSAGKLIRIVSLGDDGQYLSIADGSQMQILSQDLGISADALSMSDGTLGVVTSTANIISSNSSILGSVGSSTMVVAGRNHLMTATSSGMTGTTQLVAIQSSSDNTQQHLVAIPQRSALTAEALQQMSSLLGTDRAELGYQTITILPTEMSQNGDMNYVLIMAPQEAQKGDSQPLGHVVEGLKQETQELSEELVEINGEVKRVLRVIPKKYIAANFSAQLMCDYCDYTSPKRYLLTRHMKSHSDERPHKCKECDRGFKTPASLLNHSNTHTGTRPHKCKTCEAAFTTSGELVRHIRYRHTFEKPHRCPDCDYASVELSKLKRHMRSHTGERPYKCLHCPYASPDTYKLKRHLRIHTGEKPYECDICHARFTQSNSLKAHKLIHSGNKPVFQCGLCPTTCGRKTDLKIHFNKLHSLGSPLECKKCSQTFSDRYSYKQHVRGHDVDKNFKCEQCDFVANTERMFDLHAAVHSDGKKFDCDLCHSSFNLQQTLDRHKHSCQLGMESGMESQSPSSRDKEPAKEDGVFSLSSCNSTPVSTSQLVSAPLASDTLHKNLLQDIKSGKLGDVPQVVIVHPDGSLEEISSKGDRMNLEDIFSALSNSGKADNAHGSREGTQAKGSNDRAGSSTADAKKQKDMKPNLSDGGEDDGDDGNGEEEEEDEEENEGPETEEASQCEASTQVELESDTGSVDDDDDDSQSVSSPPHFPQVVDKESQHIGTTMRSESTEDNSASSNIETTSLHSHEASSDAMGSLLQNASSSTSSIFSTALPSMLHMSADPALSENQQFVVVKGYTCLNNDGTQPTLVNVAVDRDSLMKMLASLSNSGDSAMHLLTGDLESSVAISVDNSQTAILPLAQLQLNNFDGGLSSSLILGASFENEDLNPAHDQDLLKNELISTDSDDAYKNKECSTSGENIGLLDVNSKDNKLLSDSSCKVGTRLLDSHVKTNINLLESDSKRDTSLFNSDSKLDSGSATCASANTTNVDHLASTTASTDGRAGVFPTDTSSKNSPSKIGALICTSSSLTLIKTNLSNEHFMDGSVVSTHNQKTVNDSFCQGETGSEFQGGSDSLGNAYPPAEPFPNAQGILDDFSGDSQAPLMGKMEISSQPPRSLPFEEWASSHAGSVFQGSQVFPLAAVFESSHFVAEVNSAQEVPGTPFATEVQDQQMLSHEKQKGSNKKRTATTDVDQSLVMTGKRVRKTLVKVSM